MVVLKERMNERRSYILAEWTCANERNKSMRTLIFGRMVVHIASAKIPSARGASHHSAFMGNCRTISHKFLVLTTQWMSSL